MTDDEMADADRRSPSAPSRRSDSSRLSTQPLWGTAAADVWVSSDAERPAWSQQASSSWVPANCEDPQSSQHRTRKVRIVGAGCAAIPPPVGASTWFGPLALAAAVTVLFGALAVVNLRSGEAVEVEVASVVEDPIRSGELPKTNRESLLGRDAIGSGGSRGPAAPADKLVAQVPGPSPIDLSTGEFSSQSSATDERQREITGTNTSPSQPSAPAVDGGRQLVDDSRQPLTPGLVDISAPEFKGGEASVGDRVELSALDQAAMQARQDHRELRDLSVTLLAGMVRTGCASPTFGEAVSEASAASGVAATAVRSWLRVGTSVLCPNAH